MRKFETIIAGAIPTKLTTDKHSKILKSIIDEFILGGHLIALGAVGVVLTCALILNIKTSTEFFLLIYALTFTAILFNRYKEKNFEKKENPQRTKVLEKYFHHIKLILISSLVLFTIIPLYFKKLYFLIDLIILFIFSVLYTVTLKSLTKKIIAWKNIVFSLIVATLLVLLCLYFNYSIWYYSIVLLFTFIFFRMFLNTTFLDIKDEESDRKRNFLTIPVVFKKEKTLKFLHYFNFISFVPLIIGIIQKIFPLYSLLLLAIIPYTILYLKISKKKKHFYLTNYFLADVEFSFWPILILTAKILELW